MPTPEEQHVSWVRSKKAQGWSRGLKIDYDAKTHPDMVPWTLLPDAQKAKDYLFLAIVLGLRDKVK